MADPVLISAAAPLQTARLLWRAVSLPCSAMLCHDGVQLSLLRAAMEISYRCYAPLWHTAIAAMLCFGAQLSLLCSAIEFSYRGYALLWRAAVAAMRCTACSYCCYALLWSSAVAAMLCLACSYRCHALLWSAAIAAMLCYGVPLSRTK